jgi:hypothetical protein
MPTTRQDQSFCELMQQEIDEVKISKTALDNAIEWIASELDPDDIFTSKKLEAWAESNGYVKE